LELIDVTESLEKQVGKSWAMRTLTDEDTAMTDEQVRRLIDLHQQDPELSIPPAHDRPAYVSLFGAGLCIQSTR